MIYKGKNGNQYNLENTPFSQGGEGKIFNVIGNSGVVAKLYKDGKNDSEKEKKLIVMVNNPPSKNVMSQIAWPLDVLYDTSNRFVGFIMPKLAKNEDLNVIYEYGSTAKYASLPWRYKINIAKNLCAVLDAVHAAGHVVGDLNPKNISVDPSNGLVAFFDADSFHITDDVGKVYRCEVGMPEYLSAEIQRKMKGGLAAAPLPTFTRESDKFALAIHIFQLLMNGTHPFACRVLPTQASVVFPQPSDNILNGEFPFMQPKSGISIPIYAPPISILPQEMQDLFRRAFINGHTNPNQRPTPEEWYHALERLEKNLKGCSAHRTHEYFSGLSSCPWCEVENKVSRGLTATPISTPASNIRQTPIAAPVVTSPNRTAQPRAPQTSASAQSSPTNTSTAPRLSFLKKLLYSGLSLVSIVVGFFIGMIITGGSMGSSGTLGALVTLGGLAIILAFLVFTWVRIWKSRRKSALLYILIVLNAVITLGWVVLHMVLF